MRREWEGRWGRVSRGRRSLSSEAGRRRKTGAAICDGALPPGLVSWAEMLEAVPGRGVGVRMRWGLLVVVIVLVLVAVSALGGVIR